MTEPAEAAVSLTEAARRLDLNKSTLSRYVDKYPELNAALPGEPPKVRVSEVAAHRAENVNKAKSGNHAGRVLGDGDEDDAPGDLLSFNRQQQPRAQSGRAAALTAKDAITAQLKKLELDEKLGNVVAAEGVHREQFTMARKVRDAVLRSSGHIADRIAALSDPTDRRLVKATVDATLKAALRDIAEMLKHEPDSGGEAPAT